jgi:hypothetical protein
MTVVVLAEKVALKSLEMSAGIPVHRAGRMLVVCPARKGGRCLGRNESIIIRR